MSKSLVMLALAIISLLFTCTKQNPKLTESIQRGKEVYTEFCAVCHQETGLGVNNTFPPLAQSDYLENNKESSIRAIKYGLNGEITVNGKKYVGAMAQLGLTNKEIADVMNYISNSWGNKSNEIVTEDVVVAVKK